MKIWSDSNEEKQTVDMKDLKQLLLKTNKTEFESEIENSEKKTLRKRKQHDKMNFKFKKLKTKILKPKY